MIHGLYVIKDDVAGLCAPVFQAVNDGVARRSFVRFLGDVPDHDQDAFHLFKVGTFDDALGCITAFETKIEIKANVPSFSEADMPAMMKEAIKAFPLKE